MTVDASLIDLGCDTLSGDNINLKVRITLLVLALNLLGFYEARFAIRGIVTSATIESVRQVSAGKELMIKFSFNDESGVEQSERETIPYDRTVRAGDVIDVEFVAGNPHSARLYNPASRRLIWAPIVTGAALLVCVGMLWRHAHQALYMPRKRRFRFKSTYRKRVPA